MTGWTAFDVLQIHFSPKFIFTPPAKISWNSCKVLLVCENFNEYRARIFIFHAPRDIGDTKKNNQKSLSETAPKKRGAILYGHASGHSNREIAAQVKCSHTTVAALR